jgi:hypothetical protein
MASEAGFDLGFARDGAWKGVLVSEPMAALTLHGRVRAADFP